MDIACNSDHGSYIRPRRGMRGNEVRKEEDDSDDAKTVMLDHLCHELDIKDDPRDEDYVPFGGRQSKRHPRGRCAKKWAQSTGMRGNEVRKEEDDSDDAKTVMLDHLCHELDIKDDPRDEDYVPFGGRQSKRHPRGRCAKKWAQSTGRPSRRKSPQLWVFLLDSLCDPDLNPSIIQWVQKSKGIFRLNNSKRIAELWGERLGKEQRKPMNYEKFSRAIRYYYQHYVILSIQGRLTYQFGPNARGWKQRSLASPV